MRICVINQPVIAQAFVTLGHEALDLRLDPGPQHLPTRLEREGFAADLVLDVEHLTPRTILFGLGELACPKLFWAVDVHLNSWWHRAYAMQFDGTLCTQLPWTARLQDMGVRNVACLPWYGTARPWRPWSGRQKAMCLVGRVTAHRPVRKRMVEYLAEHFGLVHLDGLNSQEMLDAYDDTRLVPNESIFSEVNFRLFEAASSGCLVLNQAVEGGVGHVFDPGREVVEFGDILELDRMARALEAAPDRAEAMGRAAWERVQREHLPEHRCAAILDFAVRAQGAAPHGPEADVHAWQAMHLLTDGGMFDAPVAPIVDGLYPLAGSSPTVFAALVRCLSRAGEHEGLVRMLREEVERACFVDSFEVNLAASGAALRMDDWDLARTFWLRHVRSAGREALGTAQGPVALLLLWAGECERFWRDFRPGFSFDRNRTVPDSAMECLLMANEMDPGNPEAMRRMNSVAARQPGAADFRLSVLSWLTLREPDNWRLGLDLGLVNLHAMRLREGLEELAMARGAALAQNAARRFDSVLASRDPSGVLPDMVRDLSQDRD